MTPRKALGSTFGTQSTWLALELMVLTAVILLTTASSTPLVSRRMCSDGNGIRNLSKAILMSSLLVHISTSQVSVPFNFDHPIERM